MCARVCVNPFIKHQDEPTQSNSETERPERNAFHLSSDLLQVSSSRSSVVDCPKFRIRTGMGILLDGHLQFQNSPSDLGRRASQATNLEKLHCWVSGMRHSRHSRRGSGRRERVRLRHNNEGDASLAVSTSGPSRGTDCVSSLCGGLMYQGFVLFPLPQTYCYRSAEQTYSSTSSHSRASVEHNRVNTT